MVAPAALAAPSGASGESVSPLVANTSEPAGSEALGSCAYDSAAKLSMVAQASASVAAARSRRPPREEVIRPSLCPSRHKGHKPSGPSLVQELNALCPLPRP